MAGREIVLFMVLLTVKDIAARLQIKDKTIYAWASQGKIPSVRINGVLRFDPRDIEPWLRNCHVSVGLPRVVTRGKSKATSRGSLDSLIESAKRSVYTATGETRPLASPSREEGANGAR